MTTVAGSFPYFPGSHPNFDAQVDPDQAQVYPELEELNRQFPQYTIAYQPPLIGYLSYVNPAQLIIWTTERNPLDPFEQAGLLGEPGPLFPPLDEEPEPPPPMDGGEIPEPSTFLLSAAAFGLLYLANRARHRHG